MTTLKLPIRAPARRQKGVVLFIALIVLVAMTLAGIGMVRSIDTATAVAGNLGFKEASVSAGDQGIEAGYQWLLANAAAGGLNKTNDAVGYYSKQDWGDADEWFELNGGAADAAGNVISYLIHRMCTKENTAYNGTVAGQPNECATQASTDPGASGGSKGVGSVAFSGTPQVYYRITSRIQGPHNTETYVQAMVAITD